MVTEVARCAEETAANQDSDKYPLSLILFSNSEKIYVPNILQEIRAYKIWVLTDICQYILTNTGCFFTLGPPPQCNSLQAINTIHDGYTMYKNKWGVMVNTCKEFHILPLNKGDPSIRDFAPS